MSCPIAGDYTGTLPDAPELCAKVSFYLLKELCHELSPVSKMSCPIAGDYITLPDAPELCAKVGFFLLKGLCHEPSPVSKMSCPIAGDYTETLPDAPELGWSRKWIF